ncbi:unnamed protein product [Dibothriocephalus latus]|uniref:Peptidase M12B domain-containing protein n=1 Tax=Dibothriocephalus latus TaxID=60516 RepID=A0A3P7LAZ0_DIBLA|nr:unnamed protein product [Dibothriocephalus latus]
MILFEPSRDSDFPFPLGSADEGGQMSTMRGKASKEKMCTFSSCVGFTRDAPSMYPKDTARTIAHELGHSLGLRHDTEECECQGCVMATGVDPPA